MSHQSESSDDLEGAFGKQRRNVVIVAAALFIYYLAGGEWEQTIHLPIVGIKLTEPGRLVWLFWAVLIYSTWRYWLYSRELRRSAAEGWEYFYREHPKAQELMLSCFRRDNATQYADATGVANPGGVKVRMETLRQMRFGLRYSSFMGNLFIDSRDAQLAQPMLKWDVHFQVPTRTVAWLRLVCFIRAFLTNKELSDLLVPYVLVVLAITAFAGRAWGFFPR